MEREFVLSDFDYELPRELIAQVPAADRAASRLLCLEATAVCHDVFRNLVNHLAPGDLLVVNDTRVLKARVFARKDSGGEAQLLLERILSEREALCQVRVSKPLKPGRGLLVSDEHVECLARDGEFYRLRFPRPVVEFLDEHGHVPLPPYIERADGASDEARYQTVYGCHPGSVAAPTAGLHFTEELLARLQDAGVGVARVTLHVGAGTFQPVRGDDLDAHEMHREWYEVPEAAAREILATRARGGCVVAVGTTVVRTLESAAVADAGLAGSGETQLFIRPGFEFSVVDKLVTNFHLPCSTLLMLVTAFAGYERVMAAYREAVEEGYRFFSYGDAMLLEREGV